jgi:hypothetical protein
MDYKQLNKLPKLALLSHTRDFLTAYKDKDKFYVTDKYDKIISRLTSVELSDFISGLTMLITSKGEMIFYDSFIPSMKPKENELKEFIYER